MGPYHSAGKLCSYLVRAKLCPIGRIVGSCKFNGTRLEVYKNILETDTFACSNNQSTYKIYKVRRQRKLLSILNYLQ